MGKKKEKPAPKMFGDKTDLQRIGLFQEGTYVTVNDRWKQPGSGAFNEAAGKGAQMRVPGNKIRDGSFDGYFGKEYSRVFTGEAYQDPVRYSRQMRHLEMAKNKGKRDWIPNSFEKMPCGWGSFCPCVDKVPPPSFSPALKPKKPAEPPRRNLFTNPGKKGTGYGYLDITIAPFPEFKGDKYNEYKAIKTKEVARHKKIVANISRTPFFRVGMHPVAYFTENPYRIDKLVTSRTVKYTQFPPMTEPAIFRPTSPAKRHGGMKAGTINPFPPHIADKYSGNMEYPKHGKNKYGKLYYHPQGEKSRPQISVIGKNIDKVVNNLNFKEIEPFMHY